MDDWLLFVLVYFSASLLLYVVYNGLMYWLFWKQCSEKWADIKIQTGTPGRSQLNSEIFWSVTSMLVFTLVTTGLFIAWQHGGVPLVYMDIDEYGAGYFVLSILLMILLHDTWFYWMHRAIHHRYLFRLVHLRHHRSRQPTPWAVYAFHPLEALAEVAIIPLIVFVIPAHPVAVVAFIVFQHVYNTAGHTGYEFFPRNFLRNRVLCWHNTPTHHDMHHSRGGGNYGLYLNVWDRLMNTNIPGYVDEFERIKNPPGRQV